MISEKIKEICTNARPGQTYILLRANVSRALELRYHTIVRTHADLIHTRVYRRNIEVIRITHERLFL